MSEHKVLVEWSGDREDFSYHTYTRNHSWSFEGGSRVEASAGPGVWGMSLESIRRRHWLPPCRVVIC